MTLFAIFAALLIGVTAAFLLPPLWREHRLATAGDDRRAANLAIFRDQLAELEREQAEGTLAPADFEQARRELQKRLLEEVDGAAAADTAGGHARKTAIGLLVLLPLAALTTYLVIGNPRAVEPAAREARPQMTPEQINAMVARLAEKQKANPGDMQGWLMLARSYKSLGRYDEAVDAYAKAEKVINEDADLLASYAETLALAGGDGLKGKPRQLIERALKLNPEHPHSLFLAGAAAMEAGEGKKAAAYWERLLPMVEPDSDIEKMLKQGIAKMKQGK